MLFNQLIQWGIYTQIGIITKPLKPFVIVICHLPYFEEKLMIPILEVENWFWLTG